MKEINFKDRVPLYPGRVKLTPVSGQNDIFDVVRADEPTEPGTPLDKATFNSIIHSRLTGRSYIPEVQRVLYSTRADVTTSPLPTTNWILDESTNKATNGIYTVESNSNNGSAWTVENVFRSSGWQSSGGDEAWVIVSHPHAIKVKNIRFSVDFQYEARFTKLQIQGSNNGTSWTTTGELTSITTGTTVAYELGAPGEYKYYRLYFTNTDSNRVTVKSLSYSLYDVNTYTNSFTLGEEVSEEWTQEQRLMLFTPSNVDTFAVTNNTLNNIPINAILQPSRRYELRYTGAAFDIKEV